MEVKRQNFEKKGEHRISTTMIPIIVDKGTKKLGEVHLIVKLRVNKNDDFGEVYNIECKTIKNNGEIFMGKRFELYDKEDYIQAHLMKQAKKIELKEEDKNMNIKKARNKPIVREYMNFSGQPEEVKDLEKWIGKKIKVLPKNAPETISSVIIPTTEGDLRADPGTMIIKDVRGNFYPCQSEVFHKTYDIIE